MPWVEGPGAAMPQAGVWGAMPWAGVRGVPCPPVGAWGRYLAPQVGVWGVLYPGRGSGVPCPSYGHGLLVALLLSGGLSCDQEALCALQVLDSVLFPQSPHRLPSCSGPASCPDTSPCASAPSSLLCQGPGSATAARRGQALPVL